MTARKGSALWGNSWQTAPAKEFSGAAWCYVINLTPGSRKTIQLAICGGGPAASGLLAFLKRNTLLANLLEQGVAVVEAGDRIGPGKLTSYFTPANSHGCVFAECYRDAMGPDELTSHAQAAIARLVLPGRAAPFLPRVSSLLEEIGRVAAADLMQHPRCSVLTGTRLVELQRCSGRWRLVLRRSDGVIAELFARHVVLALGGTQPRRTILAQTLWPGFALSQFEEKVIGSDRLLGVPRAMIADSLPVTRRVVVVGGSHSALSVMGRLLGAPGHDDAPSSDAEYRHRRDIVVVHRKPFRYTYDSAEEARSAGYEFDDVMDVCPVTKKVNRCSGLRYQAAELSRAISSGGSKQPVSFVRLAAAPTRAERSELRRLCDRADLVVACSGYQGRVVKCLNRSGRNMPVLRDSDGGVHVDQRGRVYSENAEPLPNLYAIGLGAGIRVDAETGGEPSYRGRLDSVYVYHNDSPRALAQLLVA